MVLRTTPARAELSWTLPRALVYIGLRGGFRTLTVFPPTVFETVMSAIPSLGDYLNNIYICFIIDYIRNYTMMLVKWTRWALNPESFGYEPTAFSPIYATSPLNQHQNNHRLFLPAALIRNRA